MSKIICDVCGTKYPDSAEQCPICGRIRVGEGKTAADSFVMDETETTARPKVKGGRFSKANVRKRTKNMPRYEMEQEKPKSKAKDLEEDYDEYEEFEPRKKSGTVLNVLLAIVIVALLAVIGYIFVEYFLPNMVKEPTEPVSTTESVTDAATETEEPTETEIPTIPCTDLSLEESVILLEEEGQPWLLNVTVLPEDTTDQLLFTSSNEEVVTVSAEGRVVAVGEGDAVITISCGDVQINCTVAVSFESEKTGSDEETEEPGEEETEAPTEATTAPLKDVKLSVKTTDVTFRVRGQQAIFKLTCDLDPSEVEWYSENESVVTVDSTGLATCVGKGTTNVVVKYGDQEVKIICRCPL